MKTHSHIRHLMLAALATILHTSALADDHGNTAATATTVTVPSTIAGNLETTGDSDFFKFVLPQAAKLRVTSSGTTIVFGSLNLPDLGAHSSAYRNVAGTNFDYSQDLPAGTYYFRAASIGMTVNGSTTYPTGAYTLNFSTSAITAAQPKLAITYGGAPVTASTIINFGTIAVGTSARRPLVFTNTGNAPLRLIMTGFALNAQPPLPAGSPYPYSLSPVINTTTIAAGGTATFNLVFTPTHAATQNLGIRISTTDMSALFATFNASASASPGTVPPDIAVQSGGASLLNDSSLSFGNIAKSPITAYREVTLRNTSATPLTINSTVMQAATVGSGIGFSFATPPPTSLAGNAQATLRFAVNVAATGSRSAKLIITSNDPDESPFTLTLSANIITGTARLAVSINNTAIANNSSYDFGSTYLSLPVSRTITLTNTGTGTTSVSSWSSGGAFRFFGPFSGSLHIAPGASITSTVQFAPLILLGVNQGFLQFSSNADGLATCRINTLGNAIESPNPGDIAITDVSAGSSGANVPKGSIVAFPATSTGTTSSKTLRVTNKGTGPLYLGAIALFQTKPTATTPPGAPIIRLLATPAPGTALAPGASTDYVLQFSPTAVGISYQYVFGIFNSDTADRSYSVTLTGTSQP